MRGKPTEDNKFQTDLEKQGAKFRAAETKGRLKYLRLQSGTSDMLTKQRDPPRDKSKK